MILQSWYTVQAWIFYEAFFSQIKLFEVSCKKTISFYFNFFLFYKITYIYRIFVLMFLQYERQRSVKRHSFKLFF